MDLPVKDDGVRPAGSPDRCFYCKSPVGKHSDDCVCVKRSVLVEYKIRAVIIVPRSWDGSTVESHRNEGSFCMNNDLTPLLEHLTSEENCGCSFTTIHYIAEATEEDHERLPVLENQ